MIYCALLLGILAAKVERRDSLARFLSNRPARRDLIERNIIPSRSDTERQQERYQIGHRLNRYCINCVLLLFK